MINKTLTGARRFRVLTRVFGKPLLVLQVEWRCTGYDLDIHGGLDMDYAEWKDARAEDISNHAN